MKRYTIQLSCCGIFLAILAAAAIGAGEESRPPRLAVFIAADGGDADSAAVVQSLLESELLKRWDGVLVERKELQILLEEMQLSANDQRAPWGRLLGADFLLNAVVRQKDVECVLTKFPAATVVDEFRLSFHAPDATARQIALRAMRSIRQEGRDKDNIYVSIGALLYEDPFHQYEAVSETTHRRLRKRLQLLPQVVVTERYFPSNLLGEFRLARSGLAEPAALHLSAPPADMLIVGDYRPARVQPLDANQTELSFRIQLLSPTGMFAPREVSFAVQGVQPDVIAQRIEAAVREAIDTVPAAGRPAARPSEPNEEFAALKQQAFQLLPASPKEDGNFHSNGSYRGSFQTGSLPALQQALRAVENAMLMRDDTQLLVCKGVLLAGLARAVSRDASKRAAGGQNSDRARQAQDLLAASLDHIETALLLESNENTRGVSYEVIANGYWDALPQQTAAMAERMVRQGAAGGWLPHQIKWAHILLVRHAKEIDEKILHFRVAADLLHVREVEPDTVFNLLEAIDAFMLDQRKNAEAIVAVAQFAGELLESESPFVRCLGHYLRARIDIYALEQEQRALPHIQQMVALIPAMHAELDAGFMDCSLSYRIYGMLREYQQAVERHGLEDDVVSLYTDYAREQLAIGNLQSANLQACMARILPELYANERHEIAYELVSNVLERFTTGGSADYQRMALARWKNRLAAALFRRPRLELEQLDPIALPELPHPTRIKKLVHAFDKVWALRTDYHLQDRHGEVFSLAPDDRVAARIAIGRGIATDIVASSEHLAVATSDQGLYLLAGRSSEEKHLTPDNSPLPSARIRVLASDGRRLFMGLPGADFYHVYQVDPRDATLERTDEKLSYHSYYQLRYDPGQKRPVVQTWTQRIATPEGERLKFQRQHLRQAVHRVHVRNDEETIWEYTGVDLNYVFDFTHWRGKLIFATGNGLYTAEPHRAGLHCLVSSLDLEFFSVCPVGEQIFLGTNQGLFRLTAAQLDAAIAPLDTEAGR